MSAHPLNRPVWNALATRQSGLSIGDERARRYRPEINLFAAAAETGDGEALAWLAGDSVIGTVEPEPVAALPGMTLQKQAIVNQMVAEQSPGLPDGFLYQLLGDTDAAEMLELATMTEPGPFFANTHLMGHFIGVREQGRLVAMAGQRMRVPGFTEVSAVCTHPEHRGRGYAGKLMRVLIDRIVSEGDAAFLHVYPDNAGAIALYEALGLRFRRQLHFQTWSRTQPRLS
ncbi:GNAT family N-acetyltransferase [Sphingomonas sp.]|jgi:ribosomal protein S18 acetylase RimI-like enzyme|uniref:GNAT family N-acetyltransferase n=1 Tax=Sphingomonas sp. TaxID=28214 RepID=UPI002DF07429|nr:GNAT family N-acetyltransferase [Sphingomonas sp.]HEV2569897.1 GNAT family N-acetyltransferase [Sphingomonas sp.]